jgi:hypothetical protein
VTLNDVIVSTKKFISVFADSVDNLTIEDATYKNRAAAGCIHLAIGHHAAIALLVEQQHFGSAAALVRPQFEAFLRGAWLHRCASEAKAEEFLNDIDPPKTTTIISELEQIEDFKDRVLTLSKQKMWGALCSYTHGGGLHIQRTISDSEIIQNYSDDEMIDMLKISNLLALYSAAEVAEIKQRKDVGKSL